MDAIPPRCRGDCSLLVQRGRRNPLFVYGTDRGSEASPPPGEVLLKITGLRDGARTFIADCLKAVNPCSFSLIGPCVIRHWLERFEALCSGSGRPLPAHVHRLVMEIAGEALPADDALFLSERDGQENMTPPPINSTLVLSALHSAVVP